MVDKKTLLLVDGHNCFIRAYSGLAKQDFRNSDGIATWGVYGFLNTLTAMTRRYQPSHVLIAFDKGKSKKRLELYPQYKANRDKSSKERIEKSRLTGEIDEFLPQLRLTFEFLEAMGVPYLRIDSVEADDIIAKASIEFRELFEKVVIISADHDIRQLIRSNVIVVKPSLSQGRDVKEEVFTIEKTISEWGVEPWRLPEIWALMGDRGDNIPGVPGIGPVKAKKLIQTFGTLKEALQSEKVSEYEPTVLRAFELINLDGKDDITFPPLGNLQFNPVKKENTEYGLKLAEMFDYFEFNIMKERWLNNELWSEKSFGRKLGRNG
jgi:DNA polymerase-1